MREVAQICLYGTPGTGFTYLTARQGLARPIATRGGWDRDERAPSGEFRSLTDIVQAAKASLRALGVERGDVLVCFPGGEHCARTPIDIYQTVGSMRIEPARAVLITAKTIERAAAVIAQARYDERHDAKWTERSLEWYRELSTGERRLVSIIQGNLVFVVSGRWRKDGRLRIEGRWGKANKIWPSKREIQVGQKWFGPERVWMRQEAIASGVAAPKRRDKPEHSPFALLVEALRSRVALEKQLEFTAADGARRELSIGKVGDEYGPRSSTLVVVIGTIEGGRAELVIHPEYDRKGAPLHPAELRWTKLDRLAVDPRSIRFCALPVSRQDAAAAEAP